MREQCDISFTFKYHRTYNMDALEYCEYRNRYNDKLRDYLSRIPQYVRAINAWVRVIDYNALGDNVQLHDELYNLFLEPLLRFLLDLPITIKDIIYRGSLGLIRISKGTPDDGFGFMAIQKDEELRTGSIIAELNNYRSESIAVEQLLDTLDELWKAEGFKEILAMHGINQHDIMIPRLDLVFKITCTKTDTGYRYTTRTEHYDINHDIALIHSLVDGLQGSYDSFCKLIDELEPSIIEVWESITQG